jgi:ligand-binding sensor domain-containing protein
MKMRFAPAAAKKIIRRGLWAGVFSFFACAAMGGSTNALWFTRIWRTDDGLPNNRVDSILQGHDGYLWVATAEALVRFDGDRFTKFSFAGASQNEDLGARAMAPSRAGGFWIAPTHGRVVRLNPDFSSVILPRTERWNGRAGALVEDGDGLLWVSSANSVYQVKNNQAKRLTANDGVPDGAIFENSFATDSDAHVSLVQLKNLWDPNLLWHVGWGVSPNPKPTEEYSRPVAPNQ